MTEALTIPVPLWMLPLSFALGYYIAWRWERVTRESGMDQPELGVEAGWPTREDDR